MLFLLQEHVRQSREQQLNEIGKNQEHLEGKHAKVGTVSIHSNSTQSSDSQRSVGQIGSIFYANNYQKSSRGKLCGDL